MSVQKLNLITKKEIKRLELLDALTELEIIIKDKKK